MNTTTPPCRQGKHNSIWRQHKSVFNGPKPKHIQVMNHKWLHFHPQGFKSCLSFNHWDTHTHTHNHGGPLPSLWGTGPNLWSNLGFSVWDWTASPRVSLRQPDRNPGSQSRQWAKGRILTFEKMEQEIVFSSDQDICIVPWEIHQCQHPISQCQRKWVKIPETAP